MPDTDLPKFESPPVIETVLSAQFGRLRHYSNAHAGWFWKNYLGLEWERVSEAPRIAEQYERFGEEKRWGISGSTVTLRGSPEAERTQIYRSDNERMIQVQDSRFIYNWRKQKDSDYPSYAKLLPEYRDQFAHFARFVQDSENPPLDINQWEVTYVNHIPKGDLWESPADWPQLFPGLWVPANGVEQLELDTLNSEWSLLAGDSSGRLHISLKHVRVGAAEGPEILALQLTARGPMTGETTLEQGFDKGHRWIVLSFTAMTSELAHTHWGRIR